MRLVRFHVVLAILIAASVALLGGCAASSTILTKPVLVATSSKPEIFPESWRKPPISASGDALQPRDTERAARIMKRALEKYPGAVLAANLKATYVLSDLRYSGIHASGTNSRDSVYVLMGPVAKGYTDTQVEGTFHAEFSSILLREHARDFNEAAWIAANPPTFKYLGGGVEAVKQGKAGLAMTTDLNEQGFLRQYGQSSLENDFNGFAASLFCGDPKLWNASAQ